MIDLLEIILYTKKDTQKWREEDLCLCALDTNPAFTENVRGNEEKNEYCMLGFGRGFSTGNLDCLCGGERYPGVKEDNQG